MVDSFLANALVDLTNQSQKIMQVSGSEKVAELQQQAKSFNQLVEKVSLAKQQESNLSLFIEEFNEALNSKLKLTRISVDVAQLTVTVLGDASDEATAIDFKNSLVANGFQNVSLPFSNLVAKSDGGVTFSLTFKLLK